MAFNMNDRIAAFADSDRQRMDLLWGIVKENERLHQELVRLRDDHENEKESRTYWQRKYREKEESEEDARREGDFLKRNLQNQADREPFAIALIDGDGAIFLDKLLGQGKSGGSEAAKILYNEMREKLRSFDSASDRWHLVINIYANMEGLARLLVGCGIVDRVDVFLAFVREFNASQPYFSFTDVGKGKERSDHKVTEMFRLYSHNVHCKYIMVGPCHDDGYLNMLRAARSDSNVAMKLKLLETTPAQQGFKDLELDMIRLDATFRDTALPSYNSRSNGIGAAVAHERTSPAFSTPAPVTAALPDHGITRTASPSKSLTVHNFKAPPPKAQSITYATVGGDQPGDWIDVGAKTKQTPYRPYILLNRIDQRVDEPVDVSASGKRSLMERTVRAGKNICNNYHIFGRCEGFCQYEHGTRLDPASLDALKARARTIPCRDGSNCRNSFCPLGHTCPFRPCTGPMCKFTQRELHLKDTTPAVKQFDDGQIDILVS